MQHRTTFVVPDDPQQLRIVTAALCEDLNREIRRFETGAVNFSDLNELYYSLYQPTALALIIALPKHVPGNDPRIAVLGQDAHGRLYKSNDHIMVNASLNEATTLMQLKDIIQRLERLLAYLPQK